MDSFVPVHSVQGHFLLYCGIGFCSLAYMKVGFDAKRAFLNHTGLGNYSRNLIRGLYRYFPEHQYFLYSPKTSDVFEQDALNYNFQIRTSTGLVPSLWRSFGIAKQIRRDKLDVYHGLSHELPLAGLPKRTRKILTFHDLIYLRYPDHFPWIDRKLYDYKYKKSSATADHIIAISEQTKQDLIDFYKVPEKKISVIYQKWDSRFDRKISEREQNEVKAKYALPESYFLNVGTFNYRKNQGFLIKAYEQIADKTEEALVLVGSKGDHFRKVSLLAAASKAKNKIQIITNVAAADLPVFYSRASAYINTSLFEGFGLPLLESLVSSTPVISSNGSCFREFSNFTEKGITYYEEGKPESLVEELSSFSSSEVALDTTAFSNYHQRIIQLYY